MNRAKAGRRRDAPPSRVSGAASASQPQSRREPRPTRRWRFAIIPSVIALICLAGAGLLIYPSASAWLSQVEQSQRIDELSDEIVDLGAETLRERLAEARQYNSDLSGAGAAVAANERLPLANDPGQGGAYDYSTMLRGDSEGLMARLKIPKIEVDLPIYHGTGQTVLEHGVGHLEGTALPVGGESTHSVLTGHRGLATAELFTHLDRVQTGDTFTVEVFGEVLSYRVIETLVVDPEDTESLLIQPGQDLMTLVTCTPLGVNSHRILVTGERIIPTPQDDLDAAGESPDIPGFPWWMVVSGGVLVAVGTYVWLAGRPSRPRASSEPRPAASETL